MCVRERRVCVREREREMCVREKVCIFTNTLDSSTTVSSSMV